MTDGRVAVFMGLTPVCDGAKPAGMTRFGGRDHGGRRAQPGAPELV